MIGPCGKCGEPCFLRTAGDLCSSCYVPDRPTFGWCLSEVKRRGHDISGLKGKELEKAVYSVLGMNAKGEWKNAEHGKQSRVLTKRLHGFNIQGQGGETDR